MARTHKDSEVSVSFHYLERRDEETDTDIIRFSQDEFKSIYEGLKAQEMDRHDTPEKIEKLKSGNTAIIQKVENLDDRTVCGIFESSYWGHAYRNSQKGTITADSLNHKPFLFLLYLASSGRIYLACQYLGNFGGYTAMKNTVERLFSNKKNIHFSSFNMFAANLEKLIPTEVIFNVAKQPETITARNIYGQKVAIALKDKTNSNEYQKGVKDKILSLILNPLRSPPEKIRTELAKFLKEHDLMDIEDSEVEDCRVIAKMDSKKVTIQILDGSNYATKFPVSVPMNSTGHPEYEPLKKEALRLLKERIILRKEDV